jgi:hypothetical protein
MQTRRDVLKVSSGAAAAALLAFIPPVSANEYAGGITWVDPDQTEIFEAKRRVDEIAAGLRVKPIKYGRLAGGRDISGRLLEYLEPVCGDGLHDDAPGINAILADRYKDGQPLTSAVCLPADRLYRLESPITEKGTINFTVAGSTFESIWFPYNDLSYEFKEGEIRLFWFDFLDGSPEFGAMHVRKING